VLQSIAVCCSVEVCLPERHESLDSSHESLCCSALQFVAVCCSVFPKKARIPRFITQVAVLQCIAVCCSALKFICQRARITRFVTPLTAIIRIPRTVSTIINERPCISPNLFSKDHRLYYRNWMRDLNVTRITAHPNIANFITHNGWEIFNIPNFIIQIFIIQISRTLLPKMDERC